MFSRLRSSLFFLLLGYQGICFASFPTDEKNLFPDSIQNPDSLLQMNGLSDQQLVLNYLPLLSKKSGISGDPKLQALYFYVKGFSMYADHPDSCFYYTSKALRLADSLHAEKLRARSLFRLASTFCDVLDYKTALILYDSVIKIAERENFQTMRVYALNALGTVNSDCGDTVSAIKNYQLSLKLAREQGLLLDQSIALINLAGFESDLPDKIAKTLFAVSTLEKLSGSESETARGYANLANYETDPVISLKWAKKGLAIAEKANLSITRIGILNNLAYTYIDLGRIDLAENCLLVQAIPEAIRLDNNDWLATLYDTYSDVLRAKKDYKSAADYLRLAITERSNADKKMAASQVRLLGIMLDTKNKEITLEKNKQAMAEQRYLIRRQYAALFIAGLVILSFMLLVIIILQKTRLKLKTQQLQVSKQIIALEEKEKTAISRELHDTISNLMSQVTGIILSAGEIPGGIQSGLKARMEEISSSVRRISHRIQGVDFSGTPIVELLTELCFDMQNITGLNVNFRYSQDFPLLEFEQNRLLYRITQEWLNNAVKHAREAGILISLSLENERIVLSYSDDGPGFVPSSEEKQGIGITNIQERAKLMGGKAILKTATGEGVDWRIEIPMKKKGVKQS
jgi:signal transduction histidine kinase